MKSMYQGGSGSSFQSIRLEIQLQNIYYISGKTYKLQDLGNSLEQL